MNIKAIIQSRMTSRRYPGKVLSPFLGKPVLFHVVNCLKRTQINPTIILATSDDVADDPLALYGKHLNLKVVRGSREDVLGRFVLALKHNECDAFFRVCGDSPLLLPFLFDIAFSKFKQNKFDLVTNVHPRSFPPGMTVELIRTKIFLDTEKFINDKSDREHITQYFYKKDNNLSIHNIKCAKPLNPNIKLALDEPEDLKKIEAWYLDNGPNYEDLFPVK